MQAISDITIPYAREIQRKLLHVGSLWIPALIYFLPRPAAIGFFAFCVAFMLAGEFIRTRNYALSRLLRRLFMPMLREREAAPGFNLSGASYTVVAALCVTVLFPVYVATTVMTIMLVSDALAALVGRKWGSMPLLDKSVQGCAAFLGSAVLCVLVLDRLFGHPALYMQAGIAGAIAAMLAELFSGRVGFDDNLSIPAASGTAMWLAGFFS